MIRGFPKDCSGELLISCLDLSQVGYLCPDMPFSLVGNRSQNYGGNISRSRVDHLTEALAEGRAR
jgi:hypothetical protein